MWPPAYGATAEKRSESTSTILPLPSSPHWAPNTTAVFARILNSISPETLSFAVARLPPVPTGRGQWSCCPTEGKVPPASHRTPAIAASKTNSISPGAKADDIRRKCRDKAPPQMWQKATWRQSGSSSIGREDRDCPVLIVCRDEFAPMVIAQVSKSHGAPASYERLAERNEATVAAALKDRQVPALGASDNDVMPSVALKIACGHTVGSVTPPQRQRRIWHWLECALSIPQQHGYRILRGIRNVPLIGNNQQVQFPIPIHTVERDL